MQIVAHKDHKTIVEFSIIRNHETCPRSTWNFLMKLGLARSRHTGACFQGLNSSDITRLETGRLQLYMNSDRDDKSALSRSSSSDSRRVVINYPEFGQGGYRKRIGQLPGLLPIALAIDAHDITRAHDTCESYLKEQRLALAGIADEQFRKESFSPINGGACAS